MFLLEELLQPLSLQEFSDTYLFRTPYAQPFQARRFENLVSWKLLSEIFNSGHSDCWLPLQGELPVDSKEPCGTLTEESAQENFSKGRTVLIRHAEKVHPQMKKIAEDFQRLFKDPVDIQIYCTPAGQEGFNWHYDAEEVFVIQSQGEKEFRLRKNTVNPWPVRANMGKDLHFELESPSPEIRCHLKAGDWLYIPSGWWHKARAPLDYLTTVAMELAQNPYWRQRLPLRQSHERAQEMLRILEFNLKSRFTHGEKFFTFCNRFNEASVSSRRADHPPH